jgi:hypothetical protein
VAPDGASLAYSTYLGGDGADYGDGLAVDSLGRAWVTGMTDSAAFPLADELDGTVEQADVFVTRLDEAGSAVGFSTLVGGEGDEYGREVALLGADRAFVTGGTDSLGFPATAGAFDTTANDATDAFVLQIGPERLAVELADVRALRLTTGVRLEWRTLSEREHAGFRVLRDGPTGPQPVTARLIEPASAGGELGGARYRYLDAGAPPHAVRYWLDDVDVHGRATRHGPFAARASRSDPPVPPISPDHDLTEEVR